MRLCLELGEAERKNDALHSCDAFFVSDCLIDLAHGQRKSAFRIKAALRS